MSPYFHDKYKSTMFGLHPALWKQFGLMGVHLIAKIALGNNFLTKPLMNEQEYWLEK